MATLHIPSTIQVIVKRDGRTVPFDIHKIAEAIQKAFQASHNPIDDARCQHLARLAVGELVGADNLTPTVEQVQDAVEAALIREGHVRTAKAFILYRAERTRLRERNTRLMKTYEDITFSDASDSDIKRENANINGDTAMGMMLKYGSEGAKQFYEMFILKPEHAKAHREGDIHIHDLDFLTLTTTCCQIDIAKLFKGGFSTGHGALREPNSIESYAALACIAIQSNQNDQHGGQSIGNFDYGLADGVRKTYEKLYRQNINRALVLLCDREDDEAPIKEMQQSIFAEIGVCIRIENDAEYLEAERKHLAAMGLSENDIDRVQAFAVKRAALETERATYQAMEALVHNLNTMHSRAGAQTPFSSINYGMDTSPEGRMIIRNIMLALEAGMGGGETPRFPIHIFRLKEGVNYNPEDPNYDLFRLACRVSAKRLFPNFSFQDAPFNLPYYVPGHPETEIAYMGCRTRVMGNVYDPTREITPGRGNLSFTSVNLPRLAIRSKGDIDLFFDELDRKLDLIVDQLYERYLIQAKKKVRNYPFLMGEGIWMDSDKLGPDDEVGEILKHGTLTVGFIGLAEALVSLIGKHHGESEVARNLGLEIVSHMRDRMDAESEKRKMNYSLIATPAEGLSGRFVRMDHDLFGSIENVTDREYYTNSFHVPVHFHITAAEKIDIEAPYHRLTNAGHITYVELDGDTAHNIEAFESVIRYMHDAGIGYGAINHPVDRDPACGFNGIIADECPRCGRTEESGLFERIRRVTGYLGGSLERFSDAKRAEVRDRVKHGLPQ